MRSLTLTLCLLLTACVPTGVYRVTRPALGERPETCYTATAISTRELVGLIHDVRLGEPLTVSTRHGSLPCRVIRTSGDACKMDLGTPGGLDVRPGDSGAAVLNEAGEVVGVIEGRRRQ